MAKKTCNTTEGASSPAATGPAGSLFEGQVGAYFLLAMLVEAEPRGLPGTVIDRVAFQRAGEGHHLDDVIVHAHDEKGVTAVLEIQVKRTISFTPTDTVFRKVVGQIVKAATSEKFWTTRYELAIATAKTSKKIEGAYQDVLTWARQIGDSQTFFGRINRPGSANPDMRTLVETFRANIESFGMNADDETIWRLLRRLQILVFDFTSPGSASEDLAKERAAHALDADDKARAGNLWATLTEIAIEVAASGGDRTRSQLIDDLKRHSFRLAGSRRHSPARAKLAEDSRFALDDISDRIGKVMLTRHERLAAVYAALENGRYVEIRGDAGVGKSGILKHLAEQVAIETPVIVLSPNRTTPRGWSSMRSMLGFEGTARDLLSDLACGGSAILFVDNLDFFPNEERRTVIDLVREASTVPGMSVVVTARISYGTEETNWLPREAVERLGRAEPIIINELDDDEVHELRDAAPYLAPLLADGHPAYAVARNLFRLARLAGQRESDPAPRTEADMALQWWKTADGDAGATFRERMRLLKAVATQVLSGAGPVDVSCHPPESVESLIKSETLRELRVDHVIFRHDVLREWAIANLLHAEPELFENLPLDRPAPAALARGVELAARMRLEHADGSSDWKALLDRLSRDGVHGSWRRSVLLALVHSEVAKELLSRVSDVLFADQAIILSELIRTVMAVDVVPASGVLAPAGLEPPEILSKLYLPFGPSWHRLILWLLSLGETLPPAAIPEVVSLYNSWPLWSFGNDPITPKLLPWLYHWLIHIETIRDSRTFRTQNDPFGAAIDYDKMRELENDLRNGFLLFCNKTPELGKAYLQSQLQRRRNHDIARLILRFRGALAQAAPAELAEFTVKALISEVGRGKSRHHEFGDEFREPFGHYDHLFVPASPAQGPFYELLTHAPEQGLALIRRLVDHAISFYSKGQDFGSDAVPIVFPEGRRMFPWTRSYMWSRESSAPSCITSALMALEAWAHSRVESGEDVGKVLADVLGPPGAPAAYLLVAVDLLISHWPKTCEAVLPFLASPELLSLDRNRCALDSFEVPDIFGIKALNKEPAGPVTLDGLKQRVSRQVMLDNLLGRYALSGTDELRESLTMLLQEASRRLGTPDEQADMGDPAFMALHALNLLDPANWHQKSIDRGDGTCQTVWKYEPPEAESRHLAPLQAAAQSGHEDTSIQTGIGQALEDSSRSSAEFAATAVDWAQKNVAAQGGKDSDQDRLRDQAIIGAAMIGMRDGADDLVAQHGAWSREIFIHVLRSKVDPTYSHQPGLRYNPPAMAFAGLVYVMKRQKHPDDVRNLLQAAVGEDPATALGFNKVSAELAQMDERLPRAVLRCALAASIRFRRSRDRSEAETKAHNERRIERLNKVVEAELAWLNGEREEPVWPEFPPEEARERHQVTIGSGAEKTKLKPKKSQPEEYCNHQAAALWLSKAEKLVDNSKRLWLRDIARAYGRWTAIANGAGLDGCDYSYHFPSEWNDAYFALLAHCLPGLELQAVDELALKPICSLPDDPFFDVMVPFLQRLDQIFFNDSVIDKSVATNVRGALASQMMSRRCWKRLRGSQGASIEIHIGPAIATLFFNEAGVFLPAKCYLLPKGIDQIEPFLPVLTQLAESAPSFFVANVMLNLLEASPRSSHLPFAISAAKAWLTCYPSAREFWVDYGIGHRLCAWIEVVWQQEPSQVDSNLKLRADLDGLLAALVRLGVADARHLEEALARG